MKNVGASIHFNFYRKRPKNLILLRFGPSDLKSKSRSSPCPSLAAVHSLAEGGRPLPLVLAGPVGRRGAPARLGLQPPTDSATPTSGSWPSAPSRREEPLCRGTPARLGLTPAASSTLTSGCSRSPTFDCITRLAGADSRGGDHRPSQLLPDSAVRSCRRGPQLSGIISQKQQLQLPALPLAFCSRSSITCSLCSSPPAPRTQQLAARSVLQQGGKDLIPVSPVAPARHGLRSSSCFSFSLDSLRKRATYGVLDPVFSCIGFTCKYLGIKCRSEHSDMLAHGMDHQRTLMQVPGYQELAAPPPNCCFSPATASSLSSHHHNSLLTLGII